MRIVSKEATLREVLGEVSLLDVGRSLKGLFFGLIGVLISWAIIAALWGGASYVNAGFHIPNIAWIWIISAIYIGSIMSSRSYHRINFEFFFPKVNWIGSAILATYATILYESARFVFRMPQGFDGAAAFVAVYFFLVAPFFVALDLMNIGHARLIEKRDAELNPKAAAEFAYAD